MVQALNVRDQYSRAPVFHPHRRMYYLPMIVLAVTWISQPGHENEVADIFRKLEPASRQEPGCLQYVVHRHKDDVRRFFLYEQYRDEDALQSHRGSAHFREYVENALVGIAERRQGDVYFPLT